MYLVLGLAAVGGVAKWFLYTPNGFAYIGVPEWLSQFWFVPDTITLHCLLLDPVLSGPIWVALGMIVPSMMADLCDVDEYEHGKRREGVYGAVFSWIQKVGYSLTFLFAGIAIWLTGFNEELGPNQPAETMFAMRLCFAGFSTLAMVIGIGFLMFYNVSEKRAYEVRAILEQRRGKIPVDGGEN
jgi:GPH family glycoside/pentoside/hexuronide:cation symporter